MGLPHLWQALGSYRQAYDVAEDYGSSEVVDA